MIILVIGVLVWISREHEEDVEIRREAEKLQRGRRRRNLVQNVNSVLDDIVDDG